jgi:hypothetical protein
MGITYRMLHSQIDSQANQHSNILYITCTQQPLILRQLGYGPNIVAVSLTLRLQN